MSTKYTPLPALRFLFVLIWLITITLVKPTSALAATLWVSNTNDSGPGSLRQAIASAGSGDTISFQAALAGQVIRLASTLPIDKNLSIDATALASPVQISGDSDGNSTGDVQLFDIHPGITFSLQHATLVYGYAEQGGAMHTGTGSQLALTHVAFLDNRTSNTGSGGALYMEGTAVISDSEFGNNHSSFGGAITNGGNLTLINTRIHGNDAVFGGGIGGGLGLILQGVSLYDNYATAWGGGIYTGTAAISNSAIYSNRANQKGAGIYHNGGGSLSITNSTISSNLASNCNVPGCGSEGQGGGIFSAGEASILNSTIAFNDAGSTGGGIYHQSPYNFLSLQNVIVARNVGESGSGGNCAGDSFQSQGHNLEDTSTCGLTAPGDIAGQDPLLGSLQLNGASTPTHALRMGSPAVDAGADNVCPQTDQRGTPRPLDGNGDGIAHCDIGAFESTAELLLTVNSGADGVDSQPGDGVCLTANQDCTLRAAIQEANANGVKSVIYLTVTPITLSVPGTGEEYAATGDLDIRVDLDLIGNGIVLHAGKLDRIFDIISGHVFMRDMAILDGQTSGNGGGIRNASDLILDNVRVWDSAAYDGGGIFNSGSLEMRNGAYVIENTASNNAGGLYNDGGTVTMDDGGASMNDPAGVLNHAGTMLVTNSEFLDNRGVGFHNYTTLATLQNSRFAGNDEGGIFNVGNLSLTDSTVQQNGYGGIYNSGTMSIQNTLIYGNQDLGGIHSTGSLQVINSLITNNVFYGDGAGVLVQGGTASFTNVTIANNSSFYATEFRQTGGTSTFTNTILAGQQGMNCLINNSTATSLGNNLVTDSTCGLNHAGDLVNADPKLGSLEENGGPTRTRALLPGSAAINAANDANCPATDQRGVARPQGAHCDIGAFEVVPTFGDVPLEYWAWSYIERLYKSGVTGGCATSPMMYCPSGSVTRAQMAVFLLRGIHGSSYSPPAVGTGTGFSDVPPDHWAAAWIKELVTEGITVGCGNGKYCPEYPVTRDQMSVFLLRSKYGSTYSPPPVATGTGFNDVPSGHWAAAWIKQLVMEGITAGCGGGNYCPGYPVTRAQMAVFLVRTFNLP